MLSASSSPAPNLFTTSVATHRRSSFRITASHTATAQPTTAPSLYDVLGLKASATCNEIKAAYRKLVLTCHPDVCKGSSAPDEFMKIHAAYSTLSDPNKRANYDGGLVAGVGRQRWAARTTSYSRTRSFPGFGQRTWETDQCW